MPHQSRILMNNNESLLDICLNLHMSNTGSSDCLSKEDVIHYLNILKTALVYWEKQPILKFELFDNCVKDLIQTTIQETQSYNFWL